MNAFMMMKNRNSNYQNQNLLIIKAMIWRFELKRFLDISPSYWRRYRSQQKVFRVGDNPTNNASDELKLLKVF